MASDRLNIAHLVTIRCSAFKKTSGLKCKTKINLYKSINGIPIPCYSRFWVQFYTGSLEHHIHQFCPNDLNCCVGGTTKKYAVVRPSIPTVWLIQESIDLIQKEATTLEEVRFSFNYSCVRNLFSSRLSSLSNSHVFAMIVYNIMQPTNASCWPTTHGGKKVKRPSIFKITQQHTNNWEANIFLTQCILFTLLMSLHLGMDEFIILFKTIKDTM